MTGAMDSVGNHALMSRTGAGGPSSDDLTPVGLETPEFGEVLPIDAVGLIDTERTDFAARPAPFARRALLGWRCGHRVWFLVIVMIVIVTVNRRGQVRPPRRRALREPVLSANRQTVRSVEIRW